MQVPTAANVTNTTLNPTTVTKSQQQILIQSSGAMIAVIVIGIIIILALLLIILKTYNRRTHASRVLGARSSKPRPKVSQSTSQSNVPLNTVGVTSVSGSIRLADPATENSFRLSRVELSSLEEQHMEQASSNSGSTAVTIHEHPSIENT